MSELVSAGTVVTGAAAHQPGWLETDRGVVVASGWGQHPRGADIEYGPGAAIVPGFVDLHVHGGGGFAYTSSGPEEVTAAVAFHRTHGTTTTLASLVTAGPASLLRSVAMLAELAQDGVIAGIHLEGPWLSPQRRGAHEPRLLQDPDPALFDQLLAAGRGHLRMVTLAPELPGGLELIRRMTGAGVVAAIGHTDATFAQTRAAVDAGARVATHLFNAMPPLRHRDPGPVAALIEDDRVTLELIADGVHQDPAILRLVRRAAGAGRIALVTDAMVAAGMPDGEYTLGALAVVVRDGVAMLADPGDGPAGSLAGGTFTMDRLFVAALASSSTPSSSTPLSSTPSSWSSDDWLAAAVMTSGAASRVLGLPTGRLAPGRPADFVVLGPDLQVLRVNGG